MRDLDTTLAAIDAAVGCQRCGGPLGDLSPDFCGEGCQTAWHAARAKPLREAHEVIAGGWLRITPLPASPAQPDRAQSGPAGSQPFYIRGPVLLRVTGTAR
jgi:hypothetical protein